MPRTIIIIVGGGIFFACLICAAVCGEPGPDTVATKGEIWPRPQNQERFPGYFVLRPRLFKFETEDKTCDILIDALLRYYDIIAYSGSLERRGKLSEIINRKYRKPWLSDVNFLGYVDALHISFNGTCPVNVYPQLDMREEYELSITTNAKELTSGSIWGVLRGLETFSQLIHLAEDEATLIINATTISDFPRFAHRGLLLDTSRHFIPVETILRTLDAMAFNKMNVFHWHIVDDQSFPYISTKFPQLSEYGAFHSKSKVYEPGDVRHVIEHARKRGIRVLPEFDTPGHTRSWGEGIRELITACYDDAGKPNGKYGPVDPTKNYTYAFMKDFFEEVAEVFPEDYVHLGGDEVVFACWDSNPDVRKFMEDNNITNSEDLESYYVQRLINIVDGLGINAIVWEEVFTNGVALPDDTVVQVWIRDSDYQNTIKQVTAGGKRALMSACWYLDHLQPGGDWKDFYRCEPTNFTGSDEQKELVIGGEACMWSEVVNEYNLASRVWPRASAIAEKLWSGVNVTDVEDAASRLEEHACRMNIRGIGAQPPNGAGYCL